jgi:hypothetical protein
VGQRQRVFGAKEARATGGTAQRCGSVIGELRCELRGKVCLLSRLLFYCCL